MHSAPETPLTSSTPPPPTPVSMTDIWKTVALGLILVDHIGHFLADGWPILRVIGRLGVPIFFFMIGFARTRSIPLRWLVLGAVLTGVDYLWTGALTKTQVNILFNFALIRLALPLVETHVIRDRWRIAAFLLAMLALMPIVNPIIEYGSEGWLFAFVGLLHRQIIQAGAGMQRNRDASGLFALGVYVMTEARDYTFNATMTTLLVLGVAILAAVMHDFRRGVSSWQPGPGLAGILRFCGRHSLEIYAAQIILLAAIGGIWNQFSTDAADEDADD